MTKFNFETLTPEEAYRLNGTLDRRHIEALLDRPSIDSITDVVDEIQEGKASLPEEDFLRPLFKKFNALKSDRLKSDMITMFSEIDDLLDTLDTELRQNIEYAEEKFHSAIDLLEGKYNA